LDEAKKVVSLKPQLIYFGAGGFEAEIKLTIIEILMFMLTVFLVGNLWDVTYCRSFGY